MQGLLNNPSFYCTWFRRALHMVLKRCARPPKQPMVVGGPCVWGNVVMLVHNKIKNNNKYYMWAINNIKYYMWTLNKKMCLLV